MVEFDVVRMLAPKVEISASERMRARAKLDALIARSRGVSGPRRMGAKRAWAVAACAIALALGAAALPWGGAGRGGGPGPSVAQALVLPDGSTVTRTDVTRFIVDQRLPELRDRLAKFGVRVVVDEVRVHPDLDGTLRGWSFYPADPQHEATQEFDATWTVDQGDTGSTLRIQIGRGAEEGETYTTEGMSVFQIHPELCDAIVFDDFDKTHRNLQQLGFELEWTTLSGNPDHDDYNSYGASTSNSPPSTGRIYAHGQGTQSTEYAADRSKAIWIELVPGEAGGSTNSYQAHC